MVNIIPSPQQQAFFDWIINDRGSCMLIAVAGAGKTSSLTGTRDGDGNPTMEGAIHHMLREANGSRISIFLGAFNRDIAKELSGRTQGMPGVRAGTMHGAGFSACGRWSPDLQRKEAVDEHKCRNIFDKLLLKGEAQDYEQSFALKLASLGKQSGVGVLWDGKDPSGWRDLIDHHDLEYDLFGPQAGELDGEEAVKLVDNAIETTKRLLRASIALNRQVIDFDDMLYVPVFHNLRMWQNDWFLGDEWQDANAMRRALARKMLRPGGRAIFVGDPHQAIYGFTGADSDSMELTRKQFNCKVLPLTVTYRCPKAVVRLAQTWVSHIEAHESAPEGGIGCVAYEDFVKLSEGKGTHEDAIKAVSGKVDDTMPGAGDVVLCRNVKPMIELAYRLIRAGKPVQVAGRDIGAGLMALAKRWKVRKLDALADRLLKFQHREVEKWRARGKENKAAAVEDKVGTLLVLIQGLQAEGKHDIDDLRSLIERVFSDEARTNCLLLSTVHKAKGREWGRVFILDRANLMPSKWARQDWQVEQEKNLCYVAVTRAKRTLIDIVMRAPKPEKVEEQPKEEEAVA